MINRCGYKLRFAVQLLASESYGPRIGQIMDCVTIAVSPAPMFRDKESVAIVKCRSRAPINSHRFQNLLFGIRRFAKPDMASQTSQSIYRQTN